MNIKKNITNIVLIVHSAAIVFLFFLFFNSGLKTDYSAKENRSKTSGDPPLLRKVNIDIKEFIKNSAVKGNINAGNTIIKYNSFSCGYCRKAKITLNRILKQYPDKIKIVYKHYTRNKWDIEAGHAAECAEEEGKFWDMYEEIFNTGPKQDLNIYAKNIGLNLNKFSLCMKSGKYRKKILEDTRIGSSLGINGTPAFIINKKLFVGYLPFNVFNSILKMEMR